MRSVHSQVRFCGVTLHSKLLFNLFTSKLSPLSPDNFSWWIWILKGVCLPPTEMNLCETRLSSSFASGKLWPAGEVETWWYVGISIWKLQVHSLLRHTVECMQCSQDWFCTCLLKAQLVMMCCHILWHLMIDLKCLLPFSFFHRN